MTLRIEPVPDPHHILKGLAALRTLTGTYPSGHPRITDKLREVDDAVRDQLRLDESVRIDIIGGVAHLNGVPFDGDGGVYGLGIDSVHIRTGVRQEELHALAELLWQMKVRNVDEPIGPELVRRHVEHITVGRLVPLDTSWRARQWPDRPAGTLDPSYEESLALAERTFEQLAAEHTLDIRIVRDLVHLLILKVAMSHAALAQILAVKQYENLTYCHSVNVAVLSLLLGRHLHLDEETLTALVEAAVLHDVGKTRLPLELVKKPGGLDKRERRLMEAHTTLGAEILANSDGLRPLTPTVALEHHRTVTGAGYPDLGDGVVPHVLSQIVSVADIYEAVTGARSYQAPAPPERACLLLARLAGQKLNTALVKAFVGAVTFFPIGSLVRTNLHEMGVVIRTNAADALHPVIELVDENVETSLGSVDTSERDDQGNYRRHILESVAPPSKAVDLARFLSAT